MKNLKLTDLRVKSFTTSEHPKQVKGGTSGGPTIDLACETITIIYGTCSFPCRPIR